MLPAMATWLYLCILGVVLLVICIALCRGHDRGSSSREEPPLLQEGTVELSATSNSFCSADDSEKCLAERIARKQATEHAARKKKMTHKKKVQFPGDEAGKAKEESEPPMSNTETAVDGTVAVDSSKVIFDGIMEGQVCRWLEAVTGKDRGDESLSQWLSDGLVLCETVQAIDPSVVDYASVQTAHACRLNNISVFLRAATSLGVPSDVLFQPEDVENEKSTEAVLGCLWSLANVVKNVKSFDGPYLE